MALLCRACSVAPVSRQEDGVRQDEAARAVGVPAPPVRHLRVLPVLPHRGDGEEVFHRGDPGRDDDHR